VGDSARPGLDRARAFDDVHLEMIEDLTGAGDRFRTDDLVLGKHTLYQLSYTRSPLFSGQNKIIYWSLWQLSIQFEAQEPWMPVSEG
jgi:hypothetical protein